MTAELTHKHQYAIGVVARRTQTHPETIRVWERRYELIVPGRSESGRRLYSEDDIVKLSLVKQLTELGHSVSSLAKLSTNELKELISVSLTTTYGENSRHGSKQYVVFVNDSLRRRLGRDLLIYDDMVVVDYPPNASAVTWDVRPDTVIIEFATINEKSLSQIRKYLQETGSATAVVIYNFGTRQSILELEYSGIVCLKGSATAADVYRACRSTQKKSPVSDLKPAASSAKPPRFDNLQLGRIAALTSKIACECPNHLAELIINLSAFEQYSSECANRNEEDAQLHWQLNQSAGAARTLLEESLARLIEIEGIEI